MGRACRQLKYLPGWQAPRSSQLRAFRACWTSGALSSTALPPRYTARYTARLICYLYICHLDLKVSSSQQPDISPPAIQLICLNLTLFPVSWLAAGIYQSVLRAGICVHISFQGSVHASAALGAFRQIEGMRVQKGCGYHARRARTYVRRRSNIVRPSHRAAFQVPCDLSAAKAGVCVCRESALAASVALSMRTAAKSSSDRSAAAKAAVAAFELEMDVAVRVGWAYVEALAFRIFTEVRTPVCIAV